MARDEMDETKHLPAQYPEDEQLERQSWRDRRDEVLGALIGLIALGLIAVLICCYMSRGRSH